MRVCYRSVPLLGVLVLIAASQQVNPALFAGLRWRSIGPYRSGNIYAVAGVPSDPNVYYLGLPEGGVWKTSDGGTVWEPIFDAEAVPSIGSVAVAPSQPDTVYVGTGDPAGWSFTPGAGMYKSTDAGRTWQKVGLEKSAYLPALLVDPHNPNLVLAGALGPRTGASAETRGIFRSSDGGRNWKQVLDPGAGIADMAWDYADPKIVYATVQRGFGNRSVRPREPEPELYRSSDEGATWKPLVGGGLPPQMGAVTVAVANGTNGNRVYLLLGGLPGGRAAGVYRSDDGGVDWRLATDQIGSAGGRIYVDPRQPDVVYLMGTSIYRSLDGARSFVAFKGAPGGDDYRALWIDPADPRRMVAGVDQGPSITVDGGQTWTPWFNLPNGQFYDVFTDNQFPYWVYGAQQDSGTAGVRSRSDYGDIRTRDWYPVGGFEAGYIAPDPLNPRWIYTQGWYHVMRRFDRETGQVAVVYTPKPDARFTGMPPTLFAPTNPHRLYLAAQYVLASDDGGTHWQQLGGDLTARPTAPAPGGAAPTVGRFRPAAIASLAASPVDGNILWAGTTNGIIQLSRDGGEHWTDVSPAGLSSGGDVVNLDASHHEAGTAFAAVEVAGETKPYLYRTTNFGASWDVIVNGLAGDVRTRVVREDPKDPALLYAGTEMGAYVSFNRGDAWQPLQLNLPHTVVSDMKVQGNDLVISTYGRSFWILDDVTPLRQWQAASASATPYFFTPETATRVRWSNNHDTPLPPEVPAGQNPPEGAILDYYLPQAAQGAVTLAIFDNTGALVNQYTETAPSNNRSQPNVPEYWFQPLAVVAGGEGEHRFVWDLRYPTPKALTYSYYGNLLDYTEYTLTWHAVKGHTPRLQPVGPMANPGTYTLKLTVDGHSYTRTLHLVNDPRSAVTEADLEHQLALEKRVMAGLAVSYDAYQGLAAIRKALASDEGKATGELEASLAGFDRQLAGLVGGNARSGFGVANRDLGRRMQDLEFGDYDPTPSDAAAVEASCQQIADAAAQVDALRQKDEPVLNQRLSAAGLPVLPPLPQVKGSCTP